MHAHRKSPYKFTIISIVFLIFLFPACSDSNNVYHQEEPKIELFVGQTSENRGEATQCADGPFSFTPDITSDNSGNIYVADTRTFRILKIATDGKIRNFAGDATSGINDGDGFNARFVNPTTLGLDHYGNLYVTDTAYYTGLAGFNSEHSTIRKITPSVSVSTLAGPSMIGPGAFGVENGNGAAARFDITLGVATDKLGNVYVGEPNLGRIRKIDSASNVSIFAGYLSDKRILDGNLSDARFVSPKDFVFDSTGNMFVLDAGQLPVSPGETAKYVALVRKISIDGIVSTFAGSVSGQGSDDGQGKTASFYFPSAMTINPRTGTIYIADTLNHTIRKISKDGLVSTIIGINGNRGIKLGALPGGLEAPTGITFVPPDSLFVTSLCAILKISPLTD